MDSDIPNQPGLIGNKLGSFTENEPMDITPESSVSESTDWFSAFKTSARAIGMANATLGTVDEYGRQTSTPEPDVDVKTLQEKYPQLPGQPAFDKPLPDSVASSIYEHQQEENVIADAKARRPAGFWNGAATIGAQFAADALDPLNIAAMFVPILGEGRFVGEGASLLARTSGRVAAGAINADIGQIPLIAMKYGQSKLENDDYGAVQAMGDIATGAAMGAIFHAGISGPLGDYLARRMARSPVQTAIEADPALRQSALNTAISQAATDSEVEVRPVFDAEGLHAATEARDNLLAEAANIPDIHPDSPAFARIQQIDEELNHGTFLGAMDAELADPATTAAQRASIEEERRGLLEEGEEAPSADHLQALRAEREHIIDLETARAEAQRSGLVTAAGRSEAEISSHLEVKKAEDYATLEKMAKEAGGSVEAAYNATASVGDATLEDLKLAYQHARASDAASTRATGGERPAVPGSNAPEGAGVPGQVGGVPEPAAPGGGAGAEVAGPAGGASDAASAGAGAAERPGPITPSQIQKRDGVGYNEAVRLAQSENADLALRQKTAADSAQRAADGQPSAAAQAVTLEAEAATKVAPAAIAKQAAQEIEDHMQFFKSAEAAGALTAEDHAALQSLASIDEEAKARTEACLQAGACIARGLA